jgi:hypothetical protein
MWKKYGAGVSTLASAIMFEAVQFQNISCETGCAVLGLYSYLVASGCNFEHNNATQEVITPPTIKKKRKEKVLVLVFALFVCSLMRAQKNKLNKQYNHLVYPYDASLHYCAIYLSSLCIY